MNVRSRELLVVLMAFGLVFAIAIGHTLWNRYQRKLDEDTQMRLQMRSVNWAKEILEQVFDEGNRKKGFPSETYWETWIRNHEDEKYKGDCRRLGTHLAINRELCGKDIREIREIQSVPLFFEAPGSGGNSVLDTNHIASSTKTGMFAITWLDGHGYPYGTNERAKVIQRAQEMLHLEMKSPGALP